MMPAAPLVGAVTTRPPAAFSSFTASAYRLTQSRIVSGSRSDCFRTVAQLADHRRRAALHLQPARQHADSRMPRATQSCIAFQIVSRPLRMSASLRQTFSFSNMTCAIVLPESSHSCEQFVAAVERIRQRRRVGDDAVLGRFVVIDDEAAADRVVVARSPVRCRRRRTR